VSSIDVINTLAMTKKLLTPASIKGAVTPGIAPPDYQNTFEWDGSIAEDVQQIEIFPVVSLADNNFTFDDPGWTESPITTDPFGGVWSGGGEDIDVTSMGSDLSSGEVADTTFDTTDPVTQYNVFFQLSDGDWMVQSVGADENAFGDQPESTVVVPEPGSLLLLAIGVAALLSNGRRTKKRIALL
jgi:hypothetical protein